MNKKSALIVQARVGSSRLKSKVLLKIKGKSILEIGYSRLRQSKMIGNIIYAIPNNEENKELKNHIDSFGAIVYLGDEKDVMSRYLKCSENHNVDTIIRVTSDCPLVDYREIDKMLSIYEKINLGSLYLSNYTPPETSTYCNGSDIEIFSKQMLKGVFNEFKSAKDKEHVTFQFWDGRSKYNHLKVHWNGKSNINNIRLTVDYPEDIEVIRLLSNEIDLEHASLEEVCNQYEKLNLYKINGHFDSRAGWE